MADYNVRLSQLHQRVWQDGLGAPATISEDGWVEFGPTTLGELTIILREYTLEGMTLQCTIFEDYTDKAPSQQDLRRVCNTVNQLEDAKLHVSDVASVVRASIYLILGPAGEMPNERLLAAVILPSISRIKEARTAFETELKELS